MHLQPPLEQSIVHVPSHSNVQLPPEQLNVHVSPLWHHAEQSPPEQSIEHGAFCEQYKKHLPLEQLSSQLCADSQSSLHAPPEQSTLHGVEPSHEPSHCPAEQLQLPFVHESDERALPAGRGSGRAGAELHADAITVSRPGPTSRRSRGRIS